MTVRSSGSITLSHEYMFEGSMHRIELRGGSAAPNALQIIEIGVHALHRLANRLD